MVGHLRRIVALKGQRNPAGRAQLPHALLQVLREANLHQTRHSFIGKDVDDVGHGLSGIHLLKRDDFMIFQIVISHRFIPNDFDEMITCP